MNIAAYENCNQSSMKYNFGLNREETGVFSAFNQPAQKPQESADSIEITSQNTNSKEIEPPKISNFRLILGRLKKEDIEAINESKTLPSNAKFRGKEDLYITPNFFNMTLGTQKLPNGYEVKNDIFGFTHVVREGSKSIFIK